MRNQLRRLRPWLSLAGLLLAAVVLLPPFAAAARRYVFAETVQFAVLAIAVPALVVLGAPWRPGRRVSVGGRLAERIARARSHRPSAMRTWTTMIVFAAVAIAWRLPFAVNALVRQPVLVVVEAVTLVLAGGALWLELVESPPLLPGAQRPQLAACAALPMWAMWADAYIMGFSRATYYTAFPQLPHGLGMIADQEIAAFLLWASSGLAFVPVVFVAMLTWIRDSADPDVEIAEIAGARGAGHGALRPPKGWRSPAPRQASR